MQSFEALTLAVVGIAVTAVMGARVMARRGARPLLLGLVFGLAPGFVGALYVLSASLDLSPDALDAVIVPAIAILLTTAVIAISIHRARRRAPAGRPASDPTDRPISAGSRWRRVSRGVGRSSR